MKAQELPMLETPIGKAVLGTGVAFRWEGMDFVIVGRNEAELRRAWSLFNFSELDPLKLRFVGIMERSALEKLSAAKD